MKKSLLSVVLVGLTFVGCATITTTYKVSLKNVTAPTDATVKYGANQIAPATDANGAATHIYEDDYVKIKWFYSFTKFHFDLENKTDFSIKIPWDDVVYTNANGRAGRVMHSGVKYTDRNNAQPASVVPGKASLSDIVLPADNVYFASGGAYSVGGWRENGLFGVYTSQEAANATGLVGRTVKILLPIVIQEVTNEYTFEFSVDGITVKR